MALAFRGQTTSERINHDAIHYSDQGIALRFNPTVRIELLVEDAAVATVFEAVSFAYGAGFFSDAEMWVGSSALALSA